MAGGQARRQHQRESRRSERGAAAEAIVEGDRGQRLRLAGCGQRRHFDETSYWKRFPSLIPLPSPGPLRLPSILRLSFSQRIRLHTSRAWSFLNNELGWLVYAVKLL